LPGAHSYAGYASTQVVHAYVAPKACPFSRGKLWGAYVVIGFRFLRVHFVISNVGSRNELEKHGHKTGDEVLKRLEFTDRIAVRTTSSRDFRSDCLKCSIGHHPRAEGGSTETGYG